MFNTSLLNPQVSTGTITIGGSKAPSGYLLCDGSAISRTTYAKLFSVIGTQYGAGNGSTTFNLPNLNQKIPFGTVSVSGSVNVYGNGNVLGLTNGSVSGGWLSGNVGSGGGRLVKVASGQYPAINGSNTYTQTEFAVGTAAGVVKDGARSGLTGSLSNASTNLNNASAGLLVKFYIKY